MPEKTLVELFAHYPFPIIEGNPDTTPIRNITADSRVVKPGDLFIATKGHHVNAHKFIPQAINKGAVAAVGSEPITEWQGENIEVPYIQVENSRVALAYLAAGMRDNPAHKLCVIGVTGTDGKTTTCNLLYNILKNAGVRTGMISTVNAIIGNDILDTGYHVTTPDALDIQHYLSMMVAAGITHVVLETTSHGWAQHRVDACEFDVGILTNITHEHIDEHGNFENYRATKARLFQSLTLTGQKPHGNPRLAVLNKDDDSFELFKSTVADRVKTYGLQSTADVTAENIVFNPGGVRFDAKGPDWYVPVTSVLLGEFNVLNILAAMTSAVYGLGCDPQLASEGISTLKGIPGRMESIDLGQDFTAMVDFAHTPNALHRALQTARTLTGRRIIVIFGSAGLRDREKRRLMAGVASKLADYTVLTAEDPRIESVEDILAEMASEMETRGDQEGETFWQIPDRGDAIRFGIRLAKPGDVVIACGKGHEQSMCFGEVEYPWDDRIAMTTALSEYLGVNGPKMPFLPTQRPDYPAKPVP